MCREGLELDQSSSDRTRQGSAKAFQIRVRLHGQKPKQQLADVPERPRESNELGQLNSIRTRQVSTKALHFRAHTTDKNQNSNWQMCQRGVGMAMNSVSRRASERGKSAKRVAQPSAVARTRTKTATGGCAKEASGRLTNSASRKASERGKPAQRRCTSVRRCTDKNQNSNWRMCQKSVGKATNSVSREASERGKSAKGVAHPCAVARTRAKTATGGCAKEASGRQQTRSAEQHQSAVS